MILEFNENCHIYYLEKYITTLHNSNPTHSLPVSIARQNDNCYLLSH